MNLKLPKIAEKFIQSSNEQNLQDYLACFTEDGSIDDVGDLIRGKKAIAEWFTSKDYEYHMEPTEAKESAGTIAIITKVSGTFDGSPVNFQLQIQLRSGLIHHVKMVFLQ